MTRQEYIDEIRDFYDLRCFLEDNDCYEFDNIVDSGELDELINDYIHNNDMDWWELRDDLNEIETGWGFYDVSNGIFNAIPLSDNDFIENKDYYLDRAIENGWFDGEDTDDEESDEVDIDNDEQAEDVTCEEIDLGLFMNIITA